MINGISWSRYPGLQINAGAGAGAGQRYVASSVDVQHRWLKGQAAYVGTTSAFRSIAVDATTTADPVRESLTITLDPRSRWSLTAARRHLAPSDRHAAPATPVAVHQLAGSLGVWGVRFSGGVFSSRSSLLDNTGLSLNATRRVAEGTHVSAGLFTNRTSQGAPSTSLTALLRQTVHPRLTAAAFATHADGRTTLRFGGEFLSNLLTVNADYQTVHAPLRKAGPLVQALTLDTAFQPFGSLQLHFSTVTTLRGDLRYTISASRTGYRAKSDGLRTGATRMAKYLIRGRVVDAAGAAIAGAVLRVNDELVLTDDDGRFFVRSGSVRPLPFAVMTNEFRAPGRFIVMSAPSQVVPATDDTARDVTVVVSRGVPAHQPTPR